MNAFGNPSFNGFMFGNSDTLSVFSFFGKYQGKPIALLNVTFIGGYKNV